MGLKLKKGEKLTILGFEKDSQKHLTKIIFETVAGNKISMEADGEEFQYHFIGMHVLTEKKLEEEMDVP